MVVAKNTYYYYYYKFHLFCDHTMAFKSCLTFKLKEHFYAHKHKHNIHEESQVDESS